MSEYLLNAINVAALIVIAMTSFVLANFNQASRGKFLGVLREFTFVALGGVASAQIVFYLIGAMWLENFSYLPMHRPELVVIQNSAVAAVMFGLSWRATERTFRERRDRAIALNRNRTIG